MYCVFIKLHIPRNPALSSYSSYTTRIDPPKGGSMILVTKTSDQTRHRGNVCVCVVLRKISRIFVRYRNELIVLHLLVILFLFLFFREEKSQFVFKETKSRTHVPTSEGFEITN